MSIRELIETRTRKQAALNEIVSEYILRYISKIYKSLDEKRTIHFQKVLLYISEWSDDRLIKFYDKFNRFVEKKNNGNYDLQKNLENVIALNVKIILMLTHETLSEYNSPDGHIFLYKCLRSVAKAYYNSPKYIHKEDKIQLALVSEIVELCFQKYIPTRELMDYQSDNVEYKTNQTTSETNSDDNKLKSVQQIIINKHDSEQGSSGSSSNSSNGKNDNSSKKEEPIINYLLRDEYYESDDDNNIQNEKNDIKQITLMKKPKRV